MHPEEKERGLAGYIHDDALKDKIRFMWPSVEVYEDKLWGVMNVKLNADLTPDEYTNLIDYAIGQNADGWGESQEQHPVRTDDGDLYVSFWHSGEDYFLTPEQEFKQEYPEQEQGMQMDM
ncbi:hypothetical protein FACS1894191_6620 [Clostridia bacterium]|nr:hypothetical protein FACS1894191_6620 [Clostridia bacterium]